MYCNTVRINPSEFCKTLFVYVEKTLKKYFERNKLPLYELLKSNYCNDFFLWYVWINGIRVNSGMTQLLLLKRLEGLSELQIFKYVFTVYFMELMAISRFLSVFNIMIIFCSLSDVCKYIFVTFTTKICHLILNKLNTFNRKWP